MVLYRDLTMTRKAGKLIMARRLADEGAFNLFVIVASLVPNIALFIRELFTPRSVADYSRLTKSRLSSRIEREPDLPQRTCFPHPHIPHVFPHGPCTIQSCDFQLTSSSDNRFQTLRKPSLERYRRTLQHHSQQHDATQHTEH